MNSAGFHGAMPMTMIKVALGDVRLSHRATNGL